MSRVVESIASFFRLGWVLIRTTGANLYDHWALGLFSLLAAFALWMLIQDVENPRMEAEVPVGPGGITVQAVNKPDGLIVEDLPQVRVRVEAREADIPTLRASDFKAEVDVRDIAAGATEERPVRVSSTRDGVRIIAVTPPSVAVRMTQAVTKEFPVEVRQTTPLPEGYELEAPPEVDPAFVSVTGRARDVEMVHSVQLDLSLAGVRSAGEREEPLVARSEGGNTVTVQLSEERAKVSFKVRQTIASRTLVVTGTITGSAADGFQVVSISTEPAQVTVTGPKTVIDNLPPTIRAEALDISGARNDLTQTRQLERPPNVSFDRPSVVVRVRIAAIECGGTDSPQCPAMTFVVAPTFTDIPEGLIVQPSTSYSVVVRVSGTLQALTAVKPGDIRATVSLAGGSAGQASYPVTASIAAGSGLTLEAADTSLVVTLVQQ
ncbi:MAG TPA: CdaR family protein [Tepidiformaceae bacterium]